jgi:hypothetical protein
MEAQTRSAATRASSRRPEQAPVVNELLRAGRNEDRDRFDVLFDLWLSAVFARASASQRDRKAAEDLTREVLIDAVRTAASTL